MISRKIDWISSTDLANERTLKDLNERMISYYSTLKIRNKYRQLIEPVEESNLVTDFFLKWFQANKQKFRSILEVGCGVGRIWGELEKFSSDIQYTGLEVDRTTIATCRNKWPTQTWEVGSVYDLRTSTQYDLCFSFYVLEHLVFPERALYLMYKCIKPGGKLLLVFPDFSRTKRFPSQQLGLGIERSTKELLKKGKILNGFLTWADINFKLKPAINKLNQTSGSFMINNNPVCLHHLGKHIWPDIDAVYLANKKEIIDWAVRQGAKVSLPAGDQKPFDQHAMIIIQKE